MSNFGTLRPKHGQLNGAHGQDYHDTPPKYAISNIELGRMGGMTVQKTLPKRSNGGRPSKGSRHTFAVKPDIERAKKLVQALEILGTDGVSLLTPVVNRFIDTLDLEKLENQETLPIAQAS
jgi:hypothetical protein